MRKVRRIIKTSALLLSMAVIFSMLFGQVHIPNLINSKHGTLIVFARRHGRIAVAADSRVLTGAAISKGCKLRLPTSTTLLAISGHFIITPPHSNVELWHGLSSANEIFRGWGLESEETIQQKETLWLDLLLSVINSHRFMPSLEENGKQYVSLDIFTLISGKVRIFRVGLDAANGRFSPFRKEIPIPIEGQTQVLEFGKISMFDETTLSTRMTASEQKRYRLLMEQKQTVASVQELRALTLSLERLGSDIDGRSASENHPAEIAGPFSTATFDATEGRWSPYPAEPCAQILKSVTSQKTNNSAAHN